MPGITSGAMLAIARAAGRHAHPVHGGRRVLDQLSLFGQNTTLSAQIFSSDAARR
jgi:ABC-type phosphate transport system permease subunit